MALAFVILAVVVMVALSVRYGAFVFLKRTYTSGQVLKKFPKEKYHWFFGHLRTHPGPNQEGLLVNVEWTRRNPRYYTAYVGPFRPVLVLNHPETVKQMLKTAEPKAMIGGSGYTLLRPWLGDGLLLSDGEKWFRNRRLLTPGFHFDILKPYIDVYNRCVETLMDKFDQCDLSKSVEIFQPVSLCTLDIILRCAFSTEKDVQGQGDKEPYVNTVTSLSRLLVKRAFKPYLYIDAIYYRTQNGKRFKDLCDYSHQVALSVMRQRREELTKSADALKQRGKYVDFLDILLLARDESGNGLSDEEIRDEVVTFMFEGHDTTASGISWLLYNLARHPDIQAKARQEVDDVLDGRDSDVITWSDLTKLSYVTMCVKESLRLHPPVLMGIRQTSKSFTLDDVTLPPHTVVNVSIWNVHHNPEVWPDPMTYDPERFLPHRMATMDSYSFVPFSAGPRNCIGQNFAMNEMKTTIARILRKFEFKPDPSKTPRMLPDVVLRAESGIHLLFKKRNI